VPIIAATSPEPMATARLGQMVTLSPRRLAEQPLRGVLAGPPGRQDRDSRRLASEAYPSRSIGPGFLSRRVSRPPGRFHTGPGQSRPLVPARPGPARRPRGQRASEPEAPAWPSESSESCRCPWPPSPGPPSPWLTRPGGGPAPGGSNCSVAICFRHFR
jgi:hypothetical protein